MPVDIATERGVVGVGADAQATKSVAGINVANSVP